MASHDYLNKIRSLLTRAEHEATPEEERASCLAMAQRLMEKHAIEEYEVSLTSPNNQPKIGCRTYFKDEKRQAYIKAKRELLFGLAAVQGLKCISFGPNGRDYTEVFGFESDLDFLDMIYASILIQMNTSLPSTLTTKSAKTSYAHGYVRTVYTRLYQAKKAANHTPGTSVVLVNRSQMVADRLAEVYPDSRKGSVAKASTNDRAAFTQGVVDGYSADLGTRGKVTAQTNTPISS